MKPSGWTAAQIEEVCELIKGSAAISKTKPGPYPLVTTGQERKAADHYQFDGEIVCVPMISSTGHGHASLKRVQYQSGKFALSNLLTGLIIKDRSRLCPRFLHAYLDYFKDALIVPLMHGMANMSLAAQDLAQVHIAFPSLDQQERIVKLLDEADALRRLRAQADARTADLIPALFDEMFGDPATNPKGYRVAPIASILATSPNYGTMIPGKNKGEWLVLRVANIVNSQLDLHDLKYVDLPRDILERHTVQDGDILLARAIGSQDQLGKCIVAYPGNNKWAFDSHLMRVRLDLYKAIPDYIVTLLQTPGGRQLFIHNTRQSAIQFNINSGEFSQILVPLPPLNLQHIFANRMDKIRAMQAQQTRSRQRLDDLFQSMLHKAFQGEL